MSTEMKCVLLLNIFLLIEKGTSNPTKETRDNHKIEMRLYTIFIYNYYYILFIYIIFYYVLIILVLLFYKLYGLIKNKNISSLCLA